MGEKLISRRDLFISGAILALSACAPTQNSERVCATAEPGDTVLGIVGEHGEDASTPVDVTHGLHTKHSRAVDADGLAIGDIVCFLDNK